MAGAFPEDGSDLDGSEERRMDYIRALLDVSGEDVRHVSFIVAVSIGAIGLSITKVPTGSILGLPILVRLVLILALILLAVGALSAFWYARAIHITRMGIVRCLASADARHARELWAGEEGVYRRAGRFYWGGVYALVAGLLVAAVALIYMLLQGR